MTQKEWNDTLKKYLEGSCTPEEEEQIQAWYSKQSTDALSLPAEEKKAIEKRMWKNIRHEMTPKGSVFRWIWAAAASVVLALGYFLWSSPSYRQEGVLVLPDGTEVHLEENASLNYDKDFNLTHRNVSLQGSAFFDVKPDKSKPFIITSGELVTEVVGTSFEIAQKHDQIEVRVVTGAVTVYNPRLKNQNKVVLSPNQKAVYHLLYKNFNQTLVETPVPLPSKESVEKKFVFENTPLKKVAETFKAVYGIEFKIDDPNMENCLVSADLENLPMFTKLELVCKSVEASYTIRETTVYLNGEGCNLN
ncbi:anti-FecI sigma factor, FecR [Leadbetterella byssophila DSM 17132]|uniref:Anti-FecI sigma factor, FecR n=1 Tax=Leadbetterella byssophila (strain DSM 17132 / JCM 16389 / KACC 11308 / NBRC 106382 / 4M15) TaxID=649349 RepID=E4RVM7_LEAB4|nr:FecR family protein [Leadbetterella byssophila]ADQ17926.1 anti-FecI sigma factor, FecR [Leadbetterella byssophila DSM 17132]